jgi:uncharacterized protein YukE
VPEFGVQPEELRATSTDLAQVSSRMKGVLSRLSADLAAQGSPWGDDDSGRKFRHGDKDDGYDSQKDWVDGSVAAKTQLLEDYSESLRTGANTLEQTDDL